MKKRIFAAAVLIAALGIVILGKRGSGDSEIEAVQEAVVEVVNPAAGDITRNTQLVGKVEPEDVVYIYPKIVGTVMEVNVKAGDTVKAGDLLCVIESSMVKTAKNQLAAARLALRQAKEELGRQTVLYQAGDVSEAAYRQYQDAVTAADLNCQSANTQYEEALSQSRITSSIDGVVETVGVTLHNTVSSERPVCVISGQGARVVSFSVTDRVRKNLQVGDNIIIRKDKDTYTGSVYEISTMTDSATGLFQVKARMNTGEDLQTGPNDLATGAMVEITVVAEQVKQVLTVPADSVYQDVDKAFVYTYKDGAVHKTPVETGVSDEAVTEIRSGLGKDDLVLTTWSLELYEGARVRLADQEGE